MAARTLWIWTAECLSSQRRDRASVARFLSVAYNPDAVFVKRQTTFFNQLMSARMNTQVLPCIQRGTVATVADRQPAQQPKLVECAGRQSCLAALLHVSLHRHVCEVSIRAEVCAADSLVTAPLHSEHIAGRCKRSLVAYQLLLFRDKAR